MRALYNRDTLAHIRGLTASGKGVHAIAIEIEWSAQELRTVAKRHAIPVIEDDPAAKREAKIEVAAPQSLPRAVESASIPKPSPVKPQRIAGGLLRKDCTGFVRDRSVTLMVTSSATDAAKAVAAAKGCKPGAVLAIALDHLCRTGRLRALFDEAMAEGK